MKRWVGLKRGKGEREQVAGLANGAALPAQLLKMDFRINCRDFHAVFSVYFIRFLNLAELATNPGINRTDAISGCILLRFCLAFVVPTAGNQRIAIIMPIECEYGLRLTEGALDHAAGLAGVELLDIAYNYGDPDPLAGRALDFGGAVLWVDRDDRWVEQLLCGGVKAVNTNGEWPERVMPCVGFDGLSMIPQVADHLLGLKPKAAAYIGWTTSESTLLTRRSEAFQALCREAGVRAAAHETGRFDHMHNRTADIPLQVREQLAGFIEKLQKLAAVWCENDGLARLVCRVADGLGIGVPGDLAVVGLGDFREAQMGIPAISTIAQPGRLVGSAALAMVHRMLQGQRLAARKVIIPTPPVTIRQSTVAQTSANAPVLLAREWIHKRACEGITVNDLLELVPMSQHTFSERFAKMFGRTPGEEIRQVRCERAKHYLHTTNLTVERIGELCSYSNSAKFGNFFKRVTGMSPGQYRRSKKNVVKSGDSISSVAKD